jgi:23S rRNA G2069 N7-methylase RlmK/C1962 C5-methylase RlmI
MISELKAGSVSAKTAAQAEMFANRLARRQRHLAKWARRTGAGAYLLYDRDIPEIPLKVEYYPEDSGPENSGAKNSGTENSGAENGTNRGALCLSLYKRPYDKDSDAEAAWLSAMKAAAAERLGLDSRNIFSRRRERQQDQYGRLADTQVLRDVCEYGIRYRVNLSDYLDTGLFLDRRLFRALLRSEAAGRRVLNLFCYTASLSAAAAVGGAAAVDSVDLSNTYLDRARENFILNGLYPQDASGKAFSFIRADALRFVDHVRQGQSWDIIILDPPAFSNSKKMIGDFDLKRDHAALISRCLRLLGSGGTLYLSANVKGFKLDEDALGAALSKRALPRGPGAGVRQKTGLYIEDITEKMRDEDFKGKRIPATFRFRV